MLFRSPYTTNGASGKLNFGSNTLFSEPHVQSTPLIKTPLLPSTFFVVQLSGITVGDMELKPHGSNIVLDSGTTLTYLDRKLVQPILERVKNMIHLQIVQDPNFDLCFNTLNSSMHYHYRKKNEKNEIKDQGPKVCKLELRRRTKNS